MANESELDEVLTLVENSTSAFLDANHDLDRLRSRRDLHGLWNGICDLGLTTLLLPEALGGAGLGARGAVRIARVFGKAAVPEPLIEFAFMPGALCQSLPDGAFRDEVLGSLTEGGPTIAIVWQETAGQIDFCSRGERSGGHIKTVIAGDRLSGEKVFVALPADRLLVSAERDGKPVLVLVDCSQSGVQIREQNALYGGAVGQIVFDAVDVSNAPLLEGDIVMTAAQRAIDLGTLAVAAKLWGLIDSMLSVTFEYLKTRAQFDQTIGSFQAIQHRATDLFMAQSLTEASIEEAAKRFDQDPDAASTRAAISAAKARAATSAQKVAKESVQMHGAIGFTAEADIGQYVTVAIGLSNLLGTARNHRRRYLQLEEGIHV